MLNISKNSINDHVNRTRYSALKMVEAKLSKNVLKKLILVSMAVAIVILFLPWTQNVRSNGTVTTLEINERPQTVQSVIGGRIERWHVREGDAVKKGDTIVQISEVKDEYFDPNLVGLTENQLGLKEQSVGAYDLKVQAKNAQIAALKDRQKLEIEQGKIKIKQTLLKVQSDSISFQAATLNYSTAIKQLDRADSLYANGLKSLTDLEEKRIKAQETESKKLEAQNKYFDSQNEYLTSKIYLNNIKAKFRTDLAKMKSERLAAVSEKLTAEGEVNKLSNKVSNYKIRSGFYFITAPQDGFITKTIQNGVGETIKAGDKIVSISPADYQLAVETFIKPIDLPLMEKGQHVRIQFDGWPAIVFSGWPGASHGTYGGEIYAIDQFISENGMYRVLIKPDVEDYEWPSALRFGGGASNFMLLNNVPIWYELWRQINDFPPDFYSNEKKPVEKKK